MIALRFVRVVGQPPSALGAWAHVTVRACSSKKKKNLKNEFSPPQGATRVELATAGSAILCSTAELHTRRWGRVPVSKKKNLWSRARRDGKEKKNKKAEQTDWSGVRTHASEEKRT